MTTKINLTYRMHAGMFKYPSDPEVEIEIVPAKEVQVLVCATDSAYDDEDRAKIRIKYPSACTRLRITSHHGTHVDAPAHKIPGGKTIDAYPIEKFINPAVLIDLTSSDLLKRSKRGITLDDISATLDDYGRLRVLDNLGALVFYTGFCDLMRENEGRLHDDKKTEFEGTFPYFTEEAARHIIECCPKLNIVGIDSFAVDPRGSNSEVHRAFFAKDILPLETLYNLGELKRELWEQFACSIFTLNCVPLNYFRGDAAQTRAYADVEFDFHVPEM